MLAVEALRLVRGGATILDGVRAAFAPGRVTVVLGPNGAGKSSLLGCIAGVITAQAGAITLGGAPIAALDRRARARRIGYLPQGGDVHWDVDVATLVGLGRFPHRGRWGGSAEDAAAIAAAMAATDTTRFAERTVNTLSGGERARVLLARVLAGTPEWLLADEPLANLDPAHQLAALGCLRAAADKGVGVIAVLHDLSLAARIADDVLLLRDGRVIGAGPVAETLTANAIAATFGIAAAVETTPEGVRYVVPLHGLRQ